MHSSVVRGAHFRINATQKKTACEVIGCLSANNNLRISRESSGQFTRSEDGTCRWLLVAIEGYQWSAGVMGKRSSRPVSSDSRPNDIDISCPASIAIKIWTATRFQAQATVQQWHRPGVDKGVRAKRKRLWTRSHWLAKWQDCGHGKQAYPGISKKLGTVPQTMLLFQTAAGFAEIGAEGVMILHGNNHWITVANYSEY